MVFPDATDAGRPRRASDSDLVRTVLARNTLRTWVVVAFTVTAATPLTVVSGVMVVGIAATGLIGIPLGILVMACILRVFSSGYVAMAARIPNAGAFYAFVARGLSRRLGVGVAWVALISYNALQVGLYGVIGAAAGPVVEQYAGIDVPWWVFAGIALVITAILGQKAVSVNGSVLGVLLFLEVALIVLFSMVFVAQPADAGLSFATFAPGNLFGPGVGAILAMAMLSFIGFENSAVYAEESRDAARTVRLATYVGLAAMAVLYAGASWAMSVAVGPSRLVEQAQSQQTELFFNLAADRLGTVAADAGHVLFVTSVFAALLSFHNTCARYAFALGREGVLPAALGRTSPLTSAPVWASGAQSIVGLVVITTYAVAGLDPVVQLFFYGGTLGGLGVLMLLAVTAVAVFSYFARTRHDAGAFSAYVSPGLSVIALFAVLVLAVRNLDILLGVPQDDPLTWILPAIIFGALGLGTVWGIYLRYFRPDVFEAIGMGTENAARAAGLSTTRGH